MERVGQRQDLWPVLVRGIRVATRQARLSVAPWQRHGRPVPQLRVQLEPHRQPTLVNELLVGYNQITFVGQTLDWDGIGDANATFGIARRAADSRPQLDWVGSGLTAIGAGAADSNTLDKTFQINEKLTWLKGRHSVKFGGQYLHYIQQRFYAGNNGLLGLFTMAGLHRRAVLGLPARSGRGQGARQSRGAVDPPSRPGCALRPGRLQAHVRADAEPRHALGVYPADRREGQSPVELRPHDGPADLRGGRRPREPGAYKGYKKGFEPRLGLAWRPDDRWVLRGGYGISQYMEGTGANLRLPLNPPFFFESFVPYDTTTGAGSLATGFSDLRPLDVPSGQVRAWDPNLRPQFTQQWNVFAEYLVTPPCRPTSAMSATTRST